jgi:hypothetical protein
MAKKTKARDVQLHAAVTVMNRTNNIQVMEKGADGEFEKPVEVAQFCVQLDSRFFPFTAKQFKIAFEGLYHHCLAKARAAGILRSGE